jgi:selenocysteine lyase/cysteine desulfurase
VEEKTMLWLEVKNLHVEIDGAAARALRVTATCRASFALYNTKDEVDTLAQSMVKAREFFA